MKVAGQTNPSNRTGFCLGDSDKWVMKTSLPASMTFRYLTALGLVFLMSFSAFLMVNQIVRSQENAASIVNAAGKRRFTSQQVAFNALRWALASDIEERKKFRAALLEARQTFEQNHRGLLYGDASLKLPGTPSPAMRKYYFEGPQALDAMVNRFLALTAIILDMPDAKLTGESQDLKKLVDLTTGPLIKSLNEAVGLYQRESEAEVALLRRAEYIVMILTFFLLMAEALFIFRPMTSDIERKTNQLIEANELLVLERNAAEKANQAKSIFLTNMSHELRTPMHGILSYARFGQQKVETASKEKLKSYFSEILESGSRLMNLLNDVLDLSALDSGKVIYSMKETNLIQLATSVIREMSDLATEKKLSLQIKSDHEELWEIVDAERLKQVVRNLISNAIKFSNEETVVHIEFTSTAGKVILTVVNRGIGIPTSELETVFDKFVQSSKTRTGAGGTGLGLSICKEIVHQHGGQIRAESDPGHETKLIVELPRRQRKSSEPQAA